jgi:hypothetical protein
MNTYISNSYIFLLALVICMPQVLGCGKRERMPGGVYATPAVCDLGWF